MKMSWAARVLAFLAALPVLGQNQQDKRAEEEVRKLNGEEIQGFLHSDAKSLAFLWSDDFVVAMTGGHPTRQHHSVARYPEGIGTLVVAPGVRHRKSLAFSKLAHLVLLMRTNSQVGTRFPSAGQDESRLAIDREINQRIRLIALSSIF